MEGDARGFRVALVASELVNPPPGGLDALAVLQEEDWGVVQLPSSDYPDEVAAVLLDEVAEQVREFAHDGYRLAIVGSHAGLADALGRHAVAVPPALDPSSIDELRRFLAAAD